MQSLLKTKWVYHVHSLNIYTVCGGLTWDMDIPNNGKRFDMEKGEIIRPVQDNGTEIAYVFVVKERKLMSRPSMKLNSKYVKCNSNVPYRMFHLR